MTSEVYAWIYPPGEAQAVVCGRISTAADGSLSFLYGRSYRDRVAAIALAPEGMDLRAGLIPGRMPGALPGPIRDAAPDHWGRRVIDYLRKGESTELEYLLHGNRERIGALAFSESPTDLPVEPDDAAVDVSALEAASQGVDEGAKLSKELQLALEHGTSVGGARPKACFRDEDGEPWIAKFSSSTDRYRSVRWEAAAMRLATEAGIDVAKTRRTQINGRDALLVKRFDRLRGATDESRRLMLSALTLLNLDETEARAASYPDLAENVLLRHAEDPDRDRAELFRRMVFNILIGNTDDHARNHACFWDGRWLQLTPAYDITPLPRVGEEADQAMAVGRFGRSSTLRNALTQAGRFGLTQSDASAVIEEVAGLVRRRWMQVFADEGVPEVEVERLAGRSIMSPVAAMRESTR